MNLVTWVRFAAEKIDLAPLPNAHANSAAIDTVIQIAIVIIGALSVLFITIGGLRYIIAQGDPQATAKAKGTIIYALVGILVAIVAQGLVIFVLGSL
jgi:hypothetical protein